ncbi:hypothetical protein ACN27F_23310 [Solwaraspora sp. WMMB335]|uniref:hypothetical protein n=1 Tax=Solwaraspora sp. WMMB335 TaxID=3404118 RepID=UPI003B9523EE
MTRSARGWLADTARTLVAGVLDPAAIEPLRRERETVTAARTPQERSWVVGVVSGGPRVGATTTAIATAVTLAALRDDGVAVMTTAADERLSGRLGRPSAPRLSEIADRLPGDVPRAAGVCVVDGPTVGERVPQAQLRNAVDVLAYRHTFVLLDIGGAETELAHDALACVDTVVAVARTGPDAAVEASRALDRVMRVAPGAYESAVVAIVGGRPRTRRTIADQLCEWPGVAADRIVGVANDRSLASGSYATGQVSSTTQVGYLRIAALLGAATG